MAFPVILVNASTGSDSAASGAGPGTSVTGTAAATNVAGTTVTVDAGTVLTGVATDGSACFYLIDPTAGHRRFSKITGTAGSGGATPTVTVNEAFTGSLSGLSWAIGGVRASVGSASSILLFNNNAAAGDAMPGWTVQMQSGHTETWASALFIADGSYRSGDTTSGPITLQGDPAAGTAPVITATYNGIGISAGLAWWIRFFTLKNTAASKGSAVGIAAANSARQVRLEKMTVGISGAGWGQNLTVNSDWRVIACDLGYATTNPINTDFALASLFHGCYIHDNVIGVAFHNGNNASGIVLDRCLITNNSSHGLQGVHANSSVILINCTIANNGGDGFNNFALSDFGFSVCNTVKNCIFAGNGGWGINVLSGDTVAAGKTQNVLVSYNAFYNNTSGAVSLAGVEENSVTLTADPFTNAGARDYSLNTAAGGGAAARAAGFPGTFPAGLTTGYLDIGAAQHQSTGSAGGAWAFA